MSLNQQSPNVPLLYRMGVFRNTATGLFIRGAHLNVTTTASHQTSSYLSCTVLGKATGCLDMLHAETASVSTKNSDIFTRF